jgi:hypothetical protein
VKLKTEASGCSNCTDVKPVSNAGSVPPLANTCTRSGTFVSASTASRTDPTSERLSRGVSRSSYTS